MTLWYVITKIFTFPGALTKAFYEQLMCKIFKCPVEDNRYLRTDEMCGHVEHEFIERPVASFMYCFIPGLLNFLFGLFLGLFPLINVVYLGNYTGFVASSQILSSAITDTNAVALVDMLLPIVFMWLSVSMFNNLFPLVEDAVVMKEQYSKLFEDIPKVDIAVSMGCNVVCPYMPDAANFNWGLDDPTGQGDEKFIEVIRAIDENVKKLREYILRMKNEQRQ